MLLKNATDIKANFSDVNENVNFASWKSDINIAEKQDIIPYISQAFYDELDAEYNSDSLSPENATLMTGFIQPCLAFYAAKRYVMKGSAEIGERTGISNTDQLAALTAEEIKMLKMSYTDSADILLEAMLTFLEENKADYPTWASSTAYTEERTLFIRNATELNEWISIGTGNANRRLYLKLKSELRNAEKLLERNISKDFFADLKAKHIAGTLTADEQTVIDLAKPFLASLAMSKALNTFAKYWQYLFFGGELDKDRIKMLQTEYKERSEERTAELLSYLNNNATLFPLFLASDNYTAPQDADYTARDNSTSNVFIV